MDRVKRDRLVRYGVRAGAVAALAAVFVAALRGVSPSGALRAFASANLPMLAVLALPTLAASFALRAVRFGVLLGSHHGSGVRFRDVLGSVLVSQAANNVLPLRAGELVRTRDFVVRGYPLAKVAAAQVTEKFVELATLLAWTAPVIGLGIFLERPVAAASVLAALLVAIGIWGWNRIRSNHDAEAFGKRVPRGLGALAMATFVSLVADGMEVALIYVCLRSLGIPGGLKMSLTVLAAVNLAIALPSTPGNLGALEAGAALGLIALGVPREPAVAFALLYRCVQWLPVTLAGAAVWWIRRPPEELRATPSSWPRSLTLGKVRW